MRVPKGQIISGYGKCIDCVAYPCNAVNVNPPDPDPNEPHWCAGFYRKSEFKVLEEEIKREWLEEWLRQWREQTGKPCIGDFIHFDNIIEEFAHQHGVIRCENCLKEIGKKHIRTDIWGWSDSAFFCNRKCIIEFSKKNPKLRITEDPD